MRKLLLLVGMGLLLSACMTTRRAPMSQAPSAVPAPWEQRLAALQQLETWKLDGRAAVAVGTQGWQASLEWHEQGAMAEVHLAGPFGVGALTLKRTPDGLSLNGAPPSDAVVAQLQERLGFELPLDRLRYWLLGVPAPDTAFELVRDERERAKQVTQAGWQVDYEKYMAVAGDVLPARLVLTREGVRVRIVVDHWEGLP
jgi:outer membrane lipoprotein LolB